MRKLAIAGVVLIPALLVVVVSISAAGAALDDRVGETAALDPLVDLYERPNDNPQLFCFSSDPNPWPDARSASLVLQDCSAGKTFTLAPGKTVAISLSTLGFDGAEIHDLTVSDSSILETVTAPGSVGTFGDYFAVYRGVRPGRVDLNALWRYCGGGNCVDSIRWEATVQVT